MHYELMFICNTLFIKLLLNSQDSNPSSKDSDSDGAEPIPSSPKGENSKFCFIRDTQKNCYIRYCDVKQY